MALRRAAATLLTRALGQERRLNGTAFRWFSSTTTSKDVQIIAGDNNNTNYKDYDMTYENALDIEEALMIHHGQRPRFRDKPKFKSPRKRASSLLKILQTEAVETSIEKNPNVLKTNFRVGDAIEISYIDQGGIQSTQTDKMRGVVLGIIRPRQLEYSVYIRDVVFGEPIDRKIQLHSPLLKSLTVLEKNFVFKGKRKVKRAKLYYLRERNPSETKVTKW